MRFWPLLGDQAQALNGKLYVMGAGWNLIGPGAVPFALAGVLELEWDEANRPHRLQIELLTEDGRPVMIPTPTGERSVQIEADAEVGRPPGTRPGTPFNVPIAINLGPLPRFRRCVWLAVLLGLLVSVSSCGGGGSSTGPSVDLTGNYVGTQHTSGGSTTTLRMSLTQSGNAIGGSVNGGTFSGTVSGSNFSGRATFSGGKCDFSGQATNGGLTITGTFACSDGSSGTFALNRV